MVFGSPDGLCTGSDRLWPILVSGVAAKPAAVLDRQSGHATDGGSRLCLAASRRKMEGGVNHSGLNPDRNYLGNEIAKKYCVFAAYRLAQAKRNNAFMLRGDGLKFFRELMPNQSAVAVHCYFPDPWWKERHRRRRVIQPGFIADLQRVLKPGGIFHFWTDVEEYFEQCIDMMKEHSDLSNAVAVAEPPSNHDMDYRTHFERRMRKNDHDVFRCQFHKSA